jgi:hypothetical protein
MAKFSSGPGLKMVAVTVTGMVAGTFMLALAGTSMAAAQPSDEPAARIAALCAGRDQTDEACQCLSREAGSRFETGHLQHIADALEAGETVAGVGERLRQSGLPEAEVASIVHRLDTAQVVIQQTCGASFSEPDAG